MKHHITIIILAVRAAIIITAFMALYQLFHGIGFLTLNDPLAVKSFFSEYFTPLTSVTPYHNNKWYGGAFCIVYALLLIYFITGLVRLYKCINRIEKGEIFHLAQNIAFRKAAATVIIFAKSKYLLFCTMGGILYFDVPGFFRQLPSFLAVYLIGKFIYLLADMADRGAFIQKENELTI